MEPIRARNFIAGQWADAAGGATFESRDPADDRQVVAVAADSTAQDVERAVQAAREAFPGWAARSGPERGRVLGRLARRLEEEAESLAVLMTREMGKVIAETRGEAEMARRVADYDSGAGYRLGGETVPSHDARAFVATVREPVGVAAVVTPWNFPLAVPLWKVAAALVTGNAVVWKPSEVTPAVAVRLVELLDEAGLPRGVLNLVLGRGPAAGEPLVRHPGVAAVSFTGSTATGGRVYALAAGHGARVTCEMGGKNPCVVLADADLDAAVDGVVRAAFGTTGQRCTATSRALVERGALEAFSERLLARVGALRVGPGLDPGVQMGPLASGAQHAKVTGYLERAGRDGLEPLHGGGRPAGEDLAHGWFVEPTVFADVPRDHPLAREEVFGPVLAVLPIDDLDDAVAVANDVVYGLSASIYTRDGAAALGFARRVEAGMVHVNEPTFGSEPQVSFGGRKGSGIGDREMGEEGLRFFTEVKSIHYSLG